jgi:outer membrane protein, multidrug efflux system
MRKLALVSVLLLALTGCMVGPNYQRPPVASPQSWRLEDKEARDLANTAWWEQFDDPVLNDLIRTALEENKDVKIAAARIEEFVGQLTTTRAGLYPQIGYGVSGATERVTRRGPVPAFNPTYNFFQTFLNATWEIDVWGKIRRATEAARADVLSSEEGRRTVILSLVSAVANAYVDLIDLDKQLEIAKHTAESRKESYRIFQLRFQGGVVSALELNQVKSEYESALATIPQIQKAIALQENAISVLLGRNPGPIPRGRTIDEIKLPAVPAGLPSDLLERRPDIRQAEEDLVSANARIGVAKAAYYPTISLTGLFGVASSDLAHLFVGPAKIWSFAGSILGPIFTAGAIKGQVQAAEAVQQQTLIRYQQVIQTAFREVDDALADRLHTRQQLEMLGRQVASLREYLKMARLRYDNGYVSYIEVLDAERSLFNVELQYTQTQAVLIRASVNLYKAMGGGWVVEAEGMTGSPS